MPDNMICLYQSHLPALLLATVLADSIRLFVSLKHLRQLADWPRTSLNTAGRL